MADKKTLGKLPREAIRTLELPRLPAEIVDGFKALVDLTGTISDACDQLGIVGPALTVRNVRHSTQIHKAAQDNASGQGETEAHNLATPGDVLVMEGVMGCSNMGGQSATIGRREGEIGAIVDGTLRDPDQYREMGWPVWCRGFTPITGKWRNQTVEVNGTVQIAGIAVRPGDIVCADEAGVCFVPYARAAEVLAASRKIDGADTRRKADIESGVPLVEILQRKYK